MAHTATRDMTEGSPIRQIVSFALPMLFGCLFQQLLGVVDTAVVGKYLGAKALAAVGCTGALYSIVVGFSNGMCDGFIIPVAQSFGAKDEEALRRNVIHCIYMGDGLAIVLGSVMAMLAPELLTLLNTPQDILEDASTYISIIFAAMPITVLGGLASGVMRALGDSKTAVYFMGMAAVVNAVLDYLMVRVFHLGVAGAALATVLCQLLSAAASLAVIIRRYPVLRFRPGELVFRPRIAANLISLGLPMGLQFTITQIGTLALQVSMNTLGTVALAAVSAGNRIYSVCACGLSALNSAIVTFVGQNVGAKKPDRVHRGVMASGVIGVAYCAVVFLLSWLLGRQMLTLFINAWETEVIELGYQYGLWTMGFFSGLMFVGLLRLTIQGIGYTRIAMLSGVMEMIGRCIVALWLVPALGFTGACLSNPIAWVLACSFLFPCYFITIKKLRYRIQPAGDNV